MIPIGGCCCFPLPPTKMVKLPLTLLLLASAAATSFVSPGADADDDDKANVGKIHQIEQEKFDKLNKVATPQYRDIEHLKTAAFSPTPKPTPFPTQHPTTFPTPAPTGCLPFTLSAWSEWTPCTKLCAGGISKKTRHILIPDSEKFGNRPACPNPFKKGEQGLTLKVKKCNTQPCSFNCVLDPIDETQWKPAKNKRLIDGEMTMVMENTRTIAMQPQDGGTACPSAAKRTVYKKWVDHCEKTLLNTCQQKHGRKCINLTKWSKCGTGGIKVRNRIEKQCFADSAAGVTMKYKETQKCNVAI